MTGRKRIRCPMLLPLSLVLLSLLLFLASLLSPAVADWVNRRPGALWRNVVTAVFSVFPFSVCEILLYAIPLLLVAGIVYAVRVSGDRQKFRRFLCALLTVAAVLLSQFLVTVSAGYRVPTLAEKLSLDEPDRSVATLRETADWLLGEAKKRADGIEWSENGSSVSPYSFSVLSAKLLDAYDTMNAKYHLTSRAFSRLKPVLSVKLMSAAHFLGIWTYVTGEANINTGFPAYTIPFTSAHEMAHQRGVARENEANFTAFLVCTGSGDIYLEYCGYLGLFEYVADALYRADPEAYAALWKTIPASICGEFRAYSEYYQAYAGSPVSHVTGTLNDAYLKLQGTGGDINYSEVVWLAVSWYTGQVRGG